jgi:chromate transporter
VDQQSLNVPTIINLFLSFLRLGATSFGGPSIVAYIRRLAVEKKKWLDEGTFLEGVALCQILPGATAMQAAAYVGFKVRGMIGALMAYTGFGLPSFILMLAFSIIYVRAHNLAGVVSVFNGLQAVVIAIIAGAAVSFGRTTLKDWKSAVISFISAVMFGWSIHPIIVILCAMFLGFVLKIDLVALRSPVDGNEKSSKTGLLILSVSAACCILAFFIFQRPLFHLGGLMTVISLFAFGGGFAAIPIMFHEVVNVRGWMDSATFMNGIVLGQITPGPVSITATFIGYLTQGLVGAVVATLGIYLPSFLLLVWIAPHFRRWLTYCSCRRHALLLCGASAYCGDATRQRNALGLSSYFARLGFFYRFASGPGYSLGGFNRNANIADPILKDRGHARRLPISQNVSHPISNLENRWTAGMAPSFMRHYCSFFATPNLTMMSSIRHQRVREDWKRLAPTNAVNHSQLG